MQQIHIFKILILIFLATVINALDNGLARTPPMGWMSWTKFYCEIDCAHHPFSCINERLYKVWKNFFEKFFSFILSRIWPIEW